MNTPGPNGITLAHSQQMILPPPGFGPPPSFGQQIMSNMTAPYHGNEPLPSFVPQMRNIVQMVRKIFSDIHLEYSIKKHSLSRQTCKVLIRMASQQSH